MPTADERRGNKLDEHLILQIRRLKREGISYREIARITGVAKSTIEIHIKNDPDWRPAAETEVDPSEVLYLPKTGRPVGSGEPPDDDVLASSSMRDPDADPTEVLSDLDAVENSWPDVEVEDVPDDYQFETP